MIITQHRHKTPTRLSVHVNSVVAFWGSGWEFKEQILEL